MNSRIMTPKHLSSPGNSTMRKRVLKACDRCRLKKSKCNGSSPCSRCRTDQVICVFGERKKPQDKVYPKGYIEMLENQQTQLIAGLHELYHRLQTGEGWVGSPLEESTQGRPLTHDILARLGVLKQDGKSRIDQFKDDLQILQNVPFANSADTMEWEYAFNTYSEVGLMSKFEMGGPQIVLSDPTSFDRNHSPPVRSPCQHAIKPSCPLEAGLSISSTAVPNQEQWHMHPLGIPEMKYNPALQPPIMEVAQIQALAFTHHTYTSAAFDATNPCITGKQWPLQDQTLPPYLASPFT